MFPHCLPARGGNFCILVPYSQEMIGAFFLLAFSPQWLAADGTMLPFATDEDALDFLATAEIVSSKELEGSRNRPLKLTMRRDGVEARAIFRTVDKKHKTARVGELTIRDFHDSYLYECAAYRLARLLGVDNVPPCVLRTIDGTAGSVQLWVEHATTEYQNRYDTDGPKAAERKPDEFRKMYLFDALIDNFDRHPGNVLVDTRDRVWFIDHTRSFRLYTNARMDDMPACSDELVQSLLDLDRDALHSLRPFVTVRHLDALWRRRGQILRRLACDETPRPNRSAVLARTDHGSAMTRR